MPQQRDVASNPAFYNLLFEGNYNQRRGQSRQIKTPQKVTRYGISAARRIFSDKRKHTLLECAVSSQKSRKVTLSGTTKAGAFRPKT